MSRVADVQTVVDQTFKSFGRINVLCNNTGLAVRGEVDELDPVDWDDVITVNLRGPFLCCRAVLPHMKTQNYGRIVAVSSGATVNCSPGMAVYSASKAGLNALSHTLAAEVRE